MQILMRKLVALMCFCTSLVQAQFQDIDTVAEDLIFLTEKYISPAAEASVYQTSGGWYTNFTPKKKFDVEISLQYNLLFIPNKFKTFLINESELQNITIQGNETSSELPTALGNNDFIVLEGTIDGDVFEFNSPEGINENPLDHGQIQATVGLWAQTNVILRYTPNIKINNTEYNSFGIGIAHHLNQWINPLKDSSFYLGLLLTYSNFKVEDTFNEVDLMLGSINSMKVDGGSFGFNIVGSKSINQFDFSGSLGLAMSNFNYKADGTGALFLAVLNTSLNKLDKSMTNFKADFNVNYRIKDFSLNGMITIGSFTNLNLGINYNIN